MFQYHYSFYCFFEENSFTLITVTTFYETHTTLSFIDEFSFPRENNRRLGDNSNHLLVSDIVDQNEVELIIQRAYEDASTLCFAFGIQKMDIENLKPCISNINCGDSDIVEPDYIETEPSRNFDNDQIGKKLSIT